MPRKYTRRPGSRPPGRPRSPLSPQQLAHVQAIAAGNISRPHLFAGARWARHRGYAAARAAALQELESRWQDDLLARGSAVDIATYGGMLVDNAGIIPRLRHLRRSLLRADHRARQRRPKAVPSWEQVRQRVYAETSGLLQL